MARTIVVRDNPYIEAPAAAALSPGHLLEFATDGDLQKHSTAASNAAPIFARENDIIGDDADEAYAAGDNVLAYHARGGDLVYARVAASAAAIVRGNYLESAGDGTLRVLTADAATDQGQRSSVIATAEEAVDNSAGGSEAWIKIRVL